MAAAPRAKRNTATLTTISVVVAAELSPAVCSPVVVVATALDCDVPATAGGVDVVAVDVVAVDVVAVDPAGDTVRVAGVVAVVAPGRPDECDVVARSDLALRQLDRRSGAVGGCRTADCQERGAECRGEEGSSHKRLTPRAAG
jgi:hypothetical protein